MIFKRKGDAWFWIILATLIWICALAAGGWALLVAAGASVALYWNYKEGY